MRPNVNERIAAVVVRFDTLDALLAELALAQAETVALLATLPAAFVSQRKHLYRRIALWETENEATHFHEEHVEQFKQAVGK
jgi:transcription-repair coupling factor (superfamily II helicase)